MIRPRLRQRVKRLAEKSQVEINPKPHKSRQYFASEDMATVTKTRVTPAEYLEMERRSEFKHEYRDGEIIETARSSREHNLIVTNMIGLLGNALFDKDYEIYAADMRVKVSETEFYTYPDVVVVKGEPQLEDEHFDTLLNPTAVFEVLSPSTESYDRGQKFAHFRALKSLVDYLLIAQDRQRIERFTRQTDGQWLFQDYSEMDSVVDLPSMECQLKLSDVYRKVPMEKS